jgi:nitroreductase
MRLRRLFFTCCLWLSPAVSSFVMPQHHAPHSSRPSAASNKRVSATELRLRKMFSRLLGKEASTTSSSSSHSPTTRSKASIIVQKALTGRRTVNNFETTKVDPELVNMAIRAAIAAPNHKMTEPWRFILLGDETIGEIAALNAVDISKKDPVKGAKKKERWQAIPGWCVVTSAKKFIVDGDPLQEREDYAATCCAIQNFMLSLWVNGVGTKWTTGPITRTAEFAKLCGIDPRIEEVVGCIWYGIPSTPSQHDIPGPKRKKSVGDVTSWRP